jgi:hypothetical protein
VSGATGRALADDAIERAIFTGRVIDARPILLSTGNRIQPISVKVLLGAMHAF